MRTSPAASGRAGNHDEVDHIVVIAASAGGIEALRAILSKLPVDFPAPVVIVLHRTGQPGLLAKVLARDSQLLIKDAEEGEMLRSGIVYVAPADQHLRVTPDERITLGDHAKINYVRSSADPLFESATSTFGSRAIGVVLSGGGRNGTHGAKALHDAGGVVIAQDRSTSRHFAMPSAAIDAGAVTTVLPVDQIAQHLIDLTRER